MARLDYDALNATLRYLMFSVFSVSPGALGDQRDAIIDDASTFFKQQEERGVVVRGLYDVAGLRADADFMVWTHAERVEALQATYADFRRTTTLGRACTPVWSGVGLHRPAEFNKSHIPAFLAGEEPGAYICVYPFVRSYEWYLLPDEERRRMLAEPAWPPADTRTSGPTRCRRSRWATTNGSWRSRRPSWTASST
ncbi:chlorite dismutase [Mycobacterium tuberculosis]|nr:chlorite dismutase [Mycobacterium tuberculosis]